MASKVFEALRFDVNLVNHDPRPVEEITLRNLLDFAGIPPVTVPAIRREQQLAEKLHAYTRDYGSQDNGRAKDLYDMLVIAQELTLPTNADLAAACRQTFALRATSWPPALEPPPPSWAGAWNAYVTDYGIQYVAIDGATDYLGLVITKDSERAHVFGDSAIRPDDESFDRFRLPDATSVPQVDIRAT
jgi:hypothetical protein